MFPKIGSLPRAHGKAPVTNGNRQFGSRQCRTNMRRHVIGTLCAVHPGGIAVRRNPRHEAFQVLADLWVRVLRDQKRSAGVAEEYVTEAGYDRAFANHGLQFTADFPESPPGRRQFNRPDQGFSLCLVQLPLFPE